MYAKRLLHVCHHEILISVVGTGELPSWEFGGELHKAEDGVDVG